MHKAIYDKYFLMQYKKDEAVEFRYFLYNNTSTGNRVYRHWAPTETVTERHQAGVELSQNIKDNHHCISLTVLVMLSESRENDTWTEITQAEANEICRNWSNNKAYKIVETSDELKWEIAQWRRTIATFITKTSTEK